jgi:hypothetical protein
MLVGDEDGVKFGLGYFIRTNAHVPTTIANGGSHQEERAFGNHSTS